MATIKQRLLKKNSSGAYDTIHLETDASCITGILPVANGGTGASSLSGLASSISTTNVKYGIYSGTTDTTKTVSLGARPKVVIVYRNGCNQGGDEIYVAVSGYSGYIINAPTKTTIGEVTITTTGFTATGIAAVSSAQYNYIAFM